jgi:hypothetical protein
MLITRITNKYKIGELMKVIKEGGMIKIKEADILIIEDLSIEGDLIIINSVEAMLTMMIQKLMLISKNRKKIRENLLTIVIFLDDSKNSL